MESPNKIFIKLMLACWYITQISFARILPIFFAPINQLNNKSNKAALITPEEYKIFEAIQHNEPDVIKDLLSNKKANININAKNPANGATLLITAAWNHNFCIVEFLLSQKEIDVNAADIDGHTALHIASGNGSIKIAQMLLEHKNIQVNINTKDGTPLTLAVKNKKHEIIELLLQKKADPNLIVTTDKVTSLITSIDNEVWLKSRR
jgi:ankyrin repeat protein